ncbi:hypothetical protein HS7_09740 [Sulfolobales archaeon HS-7]|nr:hypothetical protein HS7_09740 [Sulfolobales archaeon HS-7]
MQKSLRLKTFTPEGEYVYLTYSVNNEKKEESEVLLENKRLLRNALDWLWKGVKSRGRKLKRGRSLQGSRKRYQG